MFKTTAGNVFKAIGDAQLGHSTVQNSDTAAIKGILMWLGKSVKFTICAGLQIFQYSTMSLMGACLGEQAIGFLPVHREPGNEEGRRLL